MSDVRDQPQWPHLDPDGPSTEQVAAHNLGVIAACLQAMTWTLERVAERLEPK